MPGWKSRKLGLKIRRNGMAYGDLRRQIMDAFFERIRDYYGTPLFREDVTRLTDGDEIYEISMVLVDEDYLRQLETQMVGINDEETN